MTQEIGSIDLLKQELGVKAWPDLTKSQTFELLKLAGEEKLSTAVLSQVVELTPTFRQLATDCFKTFSEQINGMQISQEKAFKIIDIIVKSFDKHREILMSLWNKANDPDKIAHEIRHTSKEMIEIALIVERMNASNNKSWWDTIKSVGGYALAILGLGATAVAAARGRK